MRSNHFYGAMAAWCASLLFLVPGLSAQAAAPRHVGVPQDWSDRHIVFTRDGLIQHPELISQEHRIARQIMQRYRGPASSFLQRADSQSIPAPSSSTHGRDWNVDFVHGHVFSDSYPSKFSFDSGGQPSCANDYVVFGLNIAGSTNQANLIGFNNLYSGTAPNGLCGTGGPTVLFAYNVSTAGGKILLSPIISEDGTKIAFVESVAGTTPSTIFHVLTWTPGGTITSPANPGSAMTSLTVAAKNSTLSAPWVDYGSDTAFLGVDGGQMYSIFPVFTGTPAPVAGWPILVSSGNRLTPPVLDNRLGLLILGSTSGKIFQININTRAVTGVLQVGTSGAGHGIVAAPIVDVTNGTTFVVSGKGGASAVVVQVDTSTLTKLASAPIGLGGVSIQQPALDNNYYNDPATGVIRVCGTGAADTTPWQYSIGFTGTIMNLSPVFSQQLLPSAAATCTGWTEFFNPNIGGGTDFFFFGLTQDCTGTGTSGCVVARTTDIAPLVTAAIPGGPSGMVIDNYSTDPQASSLYLSAIGAHTGYKFTQNGLN